MMSSGNRSRLITLLALPISDPRFATNHPIAVLLVGRTNKHRITTNATEPTPTGLPPGLHEALLDRIRRDDLSSTWLRESEISAAAMAIARTAVKAEVKSPTSSTPLLDKLAAVDPDGYVARLEAILANLELPVALRGDRGLDHPMILGMCRSRLEMELSAADARRHEA
jgi:hypothetical protein